ncbi:MAG TPA: hypothetical protein V6C69_14400 [Trichormus sp.]|jgi:hypothetical protein
MFDYQAGEKFKLTLLMVGFAGLMAGMFFTMLLMPTPGPEQHARPHPKWASDPDITGRARMPEPVGAAQQAAMQGSGAAGAAQPQQAYAPVDQAAGMSLIESWLNLAWDMNATSARQSQEKAIAYMTPDCAAAYRQNVWSPDMAKQIEDAGLQSQFQPSKVYSAGAQNDGSLVVRVEGQQVLTVPGKGSRIRPVKLEYLLKQTPDGIRIGGITEGSSGQGADR